MKSQVTLNMLNLGQAAIIAVGLAVVMLLAAHGVRARQHDRRQVRAGQHLSDAALPAAELPRLRLSRRSSRGWWTWSRCSACCRSARKWRTRRRRIGAGGASGRRPGRRGGVRGCALRLPAGPRDPERRDLPRRRPAASWRSSGRPAPANPPSRGCCSGSTTSPAGAMLIDGQDVRDVHAGQPARRDRRGAAGHRAVQRHHPLQHRLWPAGRARRTRSSMRRGWRRCMISCCACRTATTPGSASAA